MQKVTANNTLIVPLVISADKYKIPSALRRENLSDSMIYGTV